MLTAIGYTNGVLLTIYGKSANDTIPADVLRKLAKEFGHAPE
jgi:hypothetical protein